MQRRKKRVLDGVDREILRTLCKRRPLVGRQIAKNVGLTAAAIAPRLDSLKRKGIIKKARVSGVRSFKRSFGDRTRTIKAPRSIYWDLDLKS